MTSKRRYVVVGTGHRVQMYLDAMAGDHRDDAELVGLVERIPAVSRYISDGCPKPGSTSAV